MITKTLKILKKCPQNFKYCVTVLGLGASQNKGK